jgi:hypothetical protein
MVKAANIPSKPIVLEGTKPAEKIESKIDTKKMRAGFIHSENRGAAAQGKDLYKQIGITGDIGKYQANPTTIAEWSPYWLGKKYTAEEFRNDPQAQETFMDEFEAVVKRYGLTPEEAAIIWHKGWGVLGDKRPFEEKKVDLMRHIAEKRKDPKVQKYLQEFLIGYNR